MTDVPLPEVTVGSEEGFADLRLRLDGFHTDAAGALRLQASGLHRGHLVGVGAILTGWDEQALDNSLEKIYWGEVVLESVGQASDRFVSVLDEVYGTRIRPERMRGATRFLAAGLGDDPRKLPNVKAHIKLLFEHDDEEQRAEVYFNIDVSPGVVEFREKDHDYRTQFVRALLGPRTG